MARGAVRFWCSLPTADTSSFVPLELRVTEASSGAPRYSRVIQINEVGKFAGNAGVVRRGSRSPPTKATLFGSASGSPRGAAGTAGRRRRPRDTALAPTTWGPHGKPHPLRGEHLRRQRSSGSSEGEARPTAPPQRPPQRPNLSKSCPDGHHGPSPIASRQTSDIPLPLSPSSYMPTDKAPFSMPPSSPESNLFQTLDPSRPRSLYALAPRCQRPHPNWLRAFQGRTSYFYCPHAPPPCLGAVLRFSDWPALPSLFVPRVLATPLTRAPPPGGDPGWPH